MSFAFHSSRGFTVPIGTSYTNQSSNKDDPQIIWCKCVIVLLFISLMVLAICSIKFNITHSTVVMAAFLVTPLLLFVYVLYAILSISGRKAKRQQMESEHVLELPAMGENHEYNLEFIESV